MADGVDVVADGTASEREDFSTAADTIIQVSAWGGGGISAGIMAADDATLDGFTVQGPGDGMGILCAVPFVLAGTSPTIQNCIVRDFFIGIATGPASEALISGNQIFDNTVGIGARSGSMATISGNDVHDNSTVGIGSFGGASLVDGNYVYGNGVGIGNQDGSTATISNNYIGVDPDGLAVGNTSHGVGVMDGSSPTIEYNVIMNNEMNGVGIRSESGATVSNNVIAMNQWAGIGTLASDPAASLDANGNLVYSNGYAGIAANATNGTISNNIVLSNGYAGIAITSSPIEGVYNNVLAWNTMAGIINSSGTAFPIEGNIAYENGTAGIKDDSSGYDYNLMYGNNGTEGETGSWPWIIYPNYGGGWVGTHGIYPIEDPLFSDPDTWDFSLQAGSPAIDAGNPDSEFNDTDGTVNDIGAYGGPNPFDDTVLSL